MRWRRLPNTGRFEEYEVKSVAAEKPKETIDM